MAAALREHAAIRAAVVQADTEDGYAPVGAGIPFDSREQSRPQRDGELRRVAASGPPRLGALPHDPDNPIEILDLVSTKDPLHSQVRHRLSLLLRRAGLRESGAGHPLQP